MNFIHAAPSFFGGLERRVHRFNSDLGDAPVLFPPLMLGYFAEDMLRDFKRMSTGRFEWTDALYGASLLAIPARLLAPVLGETAGAVDGPHRAGAERDRRRGRGQFLEQQLDIARQDREQVVEVMGDPSGELAHRFHLLALTQRLLHLTILRKTLWFMHFEFK